MVFSQQPSLGIFGIGNEIEIYRSASPTYLQPALQHPDRSPARGTVPSCLGVMMLCRKDSIVTATSATIRSFWTFSPPTVHKKGDPADLISR